MLQRLKIENYALIEKLELEFGEGLTIITGETGAGKSIMLGALSLIMGGRADTRVISDGGAKSVVEADFVDVDPSLRELFDEKGVEWVEESGEAEVIIRREISQTGRSRVYINGGAVTLTTLTAISARLIDIHSQHANAKINSAAEQLHIVDVMADNTPELESYKRVFGKYVALRRRIAALRESMNRTAEAEGLMRFQLEQLDKLNPKLGELEEIEKRFELLSDADEVKERLTQISGLIGQAGALDAVTEANALVRKLSDNITGGEGEQSMTSRLEAIAVELKDIAATIDDLNDSIEADPMTLGKLSERMNAYYEAVKRFKLADADALVAMRDDIRNKLGGVGEDGIDLSQLERESAVEAKRLREEAERLSATREKGAKLLTEKIVAKARPLGLANLDFEVKIEHGKPTVNGRDDISFLCSFNKGGSLQPLADVASGGEISRMMLSLKGVLAGKMQMPTVIFDEIDTGVSGDIADRMGEMMRAMGDDMQVIVITHLPQVAAKGRMHYKVYKSDKGEKTVTGVRLLDAEERVREIAGMISGSNVGETAMQAARELLDN